MVCWWVFAWDVHQAMSIGIMQCFSFYWRNISVHCFFPDIVLSGKTTLLFPDIASKLRTFWKNSGWLATLLLLRQTTTIIKLPHNYRRISNPRHHAGNQWFDYNSCHTCTMSEKMKQLTYVWRLIVERLQRTMLNTTLLYTLQLLVLVIHTSC